MHGVELHPEIVEKIDPLGIAEDLSPEAIAARAEAQRQAEEFAQALETFDRAKRIKARRRRLGRNGFATRSMAVPSKHAKHRTRNSV